MAAVIQKNETVSTLRQVDIGPIWQDDGLTIAPVETDFVALGILYVTDPSDPQHLKLGTGTCVNKRKPLTGVSVAVESSDDTTNVIAATGHGILTGDGPARPDTDGVLGAATDYWFIRLTDDTFAVATSLADAYAGTKVDFTGDLTGVSLDGTASCQRGIPGEFVYTFTQAETNVSVTELWVMIDGGDYTRPNGGGKATANMGTGFADLWSVTSGDGLTNQQKINLAARFAGAKFTKVGNVYTWRDLADSKDSHSMTVVAGGRTVFTAIDLD